MTVYLSPLFSVAPASVEDQGRRCEMISSESDADLDAFASTAGIPARYRLAPTRISPARYSLSEAQGILAKQVGARTLNRREFENVVRARLAGKRNPRREKTLFEEAVR